MKVKFECSNETFKVEGYFETENQKNGLIWLNDKGIELGNMFPPNPFNRESEKYEQWKKFKTAILLNYWTIVDALTKFRSSDNVVVNHWYYTLKINGR